MEAFSEASEVSASAEEDEAAISSPPSRRGPPPSLGEEDLQGQCGAGESDAEARPGGLLSAAAVRVTAFAAEGSEGESLFLSSSLLLQVGSFAVLVDCPLDSQKLLLEPPLGFAQLRPGAESGAADASAFAESFFSVVKTRLSNCALCASAEKVLGALRQGQTRLANCSPPQPALKAILITNPLGLLGVPLLLRELRRALQDAPLPVVLATEPVAFAACAAVAWLDSEEGGKLYASCEEALREAETADSRGLGAAADGGEEAQPFLMDAADKSALLNGALGQELLGEAEGREEIQTPAWLAERTRDGGALAILQRQLVLCAFGQRVRLGGAKDGSGFLEVSPVSSGFCLGGANWSLLPGGSVDEAREVFVVGPSCATSSTTPTTTTTTATLENARSISVASEQNAAVEERLPSCASPATSCLSRETQHQQQQPHQQQQLGPRRLPLAADWTPLTRAQVVVFFETAVLTERKPFPPSAASASGLSEHAEPTNATNATNASFKEASAGAAPVRAAECLDSSRSGDGIPSALFVGRVICAALKSGLSVLVPVDPCGVLLAELLSTVRRLVAANFQSAGPVAVVGCHFRGLLKNWETAVESSACACGVETHFHQLDPHGPASPDSTASPFDFSGLVVTGRQLEVADSLEDLRLTTNPCVVFASSLLLRVGAAASLVQRWRLRPDALLLLVDPGRGSAGKEGVSLRIPKPEERRRLRSETAAALRSGLAVLRKDGTHLDLAAAVARQIQVQAAEAASGLCKSSLLWPVLFDEEFLAGALSADLITSTAESPEEKRSSPTCDDVFMQVACVPVDVRLSTSQLQTLLQKMSDKQRALLALPTPAQAVCCEEANKRRATAVCCQFLYKEETVDIPLEAKAASSEDACRLARDFFDFRLGLNSWENSSETAQCVPLGADGEGTEAEEPQRQAVFVSPIALGSTARPSAGEAAVGFGPQAQQGPPAGAAETGHDSVAAGAGRAVFFGRLCPEELQRSLVEAGFADARLSPLPTNQRRLAGCACLDSRNSAALSGLEVPSLGARLSLFGCCGVVEINAKSPQARARLREVVRDQLLSACAEEDLVPSAPSTG